MHHLFTVIAIANPQRDRDAAIPDSAKRWPNGVSKLGPRLRRCPSIETPLGECFESAGELCPIYHHFSCICTHKTLVLDKQEMHVDRDQHTI